MGSKASSDYKSFRRLLRRADIHEEEKVGLLMRNYQTFLMLIADISSGGPRRAVYDLDLFSDDELARIKEAGRIYLPLLERTWIDSPTFRL